MNERSVLPMLLMASCRSHSSESVSPAQAEELSSAEQIVRLQYDAYNRHDLDAIVDHTRRTFGRTATPIHCYLKGAIHCGPVSGGCFRPLPRFMPILIPAWHSETSWYRRRRRQACPEAKPTPVSSCGKSTMGKLPGSRNWSPPNNRAPRVS